VLVLQSNRELVESLLAVDDLPYNLPKSELPMRTPAYSNLFSCLYDEPDPVGHLGGGAHYSVFRSVEWLDVAREPLTIPQVHDFAVVWDEDHDTRVIDVIEALYMEGLLSPIQFIGERKGTLTVIVAAKFYYACSRASLGAYIKQLNNISENPNHGDSWPTTVGVFDRSPGSPHQTELHGLIMAEDHRVITYLRNIDSLWNLGTKPFVQRHYAESHLPSIPSIP
jgi:hypothetical protein